VVWCEATMASVLRGIRGARAVGSAGLSRPSATLLGRRWFASASQGGLTPPDLLRNIGISAHIDSGKTTLTERILFFTGRIDEIHDVRGRDGVGAKMDSMELERERGITIQSAATFTSWKGKSINIIDTPGHVDFTVEVERALRVLDGAIMVLCSVGGVQSQSITVDRQMKRYSVPRIAFINKCDRMGAAPFRVVDELREKLRLNAALVQVPIGLEDMHSGCVDIIEQKAYVNFGESGEVIEEGPIPEDLLDLVQEKRQELIERLAEVDEEIEELFLMEEEPDAATLKAAVRRATVATKFVPVFVGSAYKNKGVQPLLDGVDAYLPSPLERKYEYLDLNDEEKPKSLACDDTQPLVALAFKLEEGRFGQLTYIRVYQGKIEKGKSIRNSTSGKKIKVSRLVRMHANEMEEVDVVGPGEICAIFGVDCNSGDTFANADIPAKDFNPSLMTMFVPSPVVSLAVKPLDRAGGSTKFSKALNRFMREDPTFRVHVDSESNETIISGMGELHLEVYVERIKREYQVECQIGAPQVNYRESVTQQASFDHLHKKQTGGSGQFAKVIGTIEPLGEDDEDQTFVFENGIVGNVIPPEYITACQKGFEEASKEGPLVGMPVLGVRITLTDGAAHSVDSSEMAFKTAAKNAFRGAFQSAGPVLLEPIMSVEIECPDDYQGTVVGGLNRRRGMIQDTSSRDGFTTIRCDVPLAEMFGYSTELRSATSAKGEFTMEFKEHAPVPPHEQERLVTAARKAAEEKAAASA